MPVHQKPVSLAMCIFRCLAFVSTAPQKSLAVLRDQTVQPSAVRRCFDAFGDITHWGEPTPVFQYMLVFFIFYVKSILVLCELYFLCSIFLLMLGHLSCAMLFFCSSVLTKPHSSHGECLHSEGAPWGTYRNLGISASEQQKQMRKEEFSWHKSTHIKVFILHILHSADMVNTQCPNSIHGLLLHDHHQAV